MEEEILSEGGGHPDDDDDDVPRGAGALVDEDGVQSGGQVDVGQSCNARTPQHLREWQSSWPGTVSQKFSSLSSSFKGFWLWWPYLGLAFVEEALQGHDMFLVNLI